MKRQDVWCLTIRYWPSAANAGVTPIPTYAFEEGPQFYRPHKIRFLYPPTYEDFLEVYGRTPWMSVWRDTLLPVLEKTEWPIPPLTKKRVFVDLMEDGKQVGELTVDREYLWENNSTERPAS